MLPEYKHQVEQVVLLRKKLAEVEARRSRYEKNIPAEIWEEFAEASRHLELAEARVHQSCQEITAGSNQVRSAIIASLEQYNACRERMRELEGDFLANIVRPGQHLKNAIHRREQLEAAYLRLRANIEREGYSSQGDLETDLHLVLGHAETIGTSAEEEEPDEPENGSLPDHSRWASVEDVVDNLSRIELRKEFKRVVLPRIHPDTSNTPVEVFKTAYEAYKQADPVLMEAYIVEYRGEINADQAGDVLECLDIAEKNRHDLYQLHARLQKKLDKMERELTHQEKEDAGKVREDMRRQRQEILERIQAEAELILHWRDRIEGLVQYYLDRRGQASA